MAVIQESAIDDLVQDVREGLEIFSRAHPESLAKDLCELTRRIELARMYAISLKAGIPSIDLRNYIVDPAIQKLVPEAVCKEHCLLPINRVDDRLTVAMENPLYAAAIRDVEKRTGLTVRPVVAIRSHIMEYLECAYC